ncbi:MAG: YggT family protein [Clostridia bacterium]|nr:YggT family protein [Clostridia bacterium]
MIGLLLSCLNVFLSIIQFAMLVRAILSWVMPDASGLIIEFLYLITEPFISLVRKLFDKLGFNNNSPIDLSFFVTVILLEVIRIIINF